MTKYRQLLTGIGAVFVGLFFGGLIMIVTGNNPITAYFYLLKGAFSSIGRIGNVLLIASTLIFTGLAAAFAFKTGLFNIGIAGQMFVGGFSAVYVTQVLQLPAPLSQIVALIVGVVVGALWAFIPGLLKAIFNVNEVVSTIMMNWIGYWIVFYSFALPAVKGKFESETKVVPDHLTLRVDWLRNLFGGSYINLSIFIAIAAIFLVWFILEKTTFGYELKAVGLNRNAAKYAGMKVERNFVYAMMISGALAGLAGATFYLGESTTIVNTALPAQGMNGIAVSLLGANQPFGVALSSIFFSIIETGKGYMSSMTSIPKEISDLIIAVIIFFSAMSSFIGNQIESYIKKRNANQKKVGGQDA